MILPATPPSARLLRGLSFCAALLFPVSPLLALEWKTRTQDLPLRPFQTSAEIEFTFTNTSQSRVTITDLQTNCDCMAAAADKRTYAPGATGTLKAHFSVGDRFGVYERTITVFTDETGPPARLVVRLTMPEVARLAPRTVEWDAAEQSPREKAIEIEVAPALQLDFTETFSTADSFSVRLETLEPGRRYRLFVRPREPGRPASTAIRLRGKERSGHDVIISAYANVR